MKKWCGSSKRTKATVRNLLLAAMLTGALVVSGCASAERYPDYAMSVQVVDHSRQPQEGLLVTVWIVDEDARGTSQEVVELEPSVTDADGVAQFVYTAMRPPYICGYRLEDDAGEVVLSELPSPTKRMSTADGDLFLTL